MGAEASERGLQRFPAVLCRQATTSGQQPSLPRERMMGRKSVRWASCLDAQTTRLETCNRLQALCDDAEAFKAFTMPSCQLGIVCVGESHLLLASPQPRGHQATGPTDH